MTRFRLWHLKNVMLAANFLANLIGVVLIELFLLKNKGSNPEEFLQHPVVNIVNYGFNITAFAFVLIATLIYERPIRAYLNAKFHKSSASSATKSLARQRLLNEPFVLMALSFSMWVLAAIVYPVLYWALDIDRYWMQNVCFMSLSTGLIIVTVAFFLLEHVLQKRLAPNFFPNGGLYTIPKTLRIRIHTRLAALLFACNIIPLISIFLINHQIILFQSEPARALDVLRSSIFINVIIFMIFGSLIAILVSRNLTLPFGEIIQTLRGVRNGQFGKKVRVTSNDEIGYTGDVINEMTDGLIEREKMQKSLNLAREVQQNLLPKSNLKVNGVDIAGKSIYCDETGGDYYDFISIQDADKQNIGVAIGDVSGHGISSALLMATVRSSLRQRASLPGSTAMIISDVNRQLVKDVEDSGQFMTLFFLSLVTESRQLEWVRAGHDPAIFYDPGSDSFSELGGSGIALGLDGEWIYEDNKKTDFSNGQIIFLSTDGIWEARNKKGEMLGKEPILNTIRHNSSLDATQIIDSVFDTLDKFLGGEKIDDDVTSVVIKM
ncbi:MAG: SpoIIE family protein phosphatase [candidate division Zixibacteria bacterium]|nr:SpoIIE family protein phosphatase [candidate division Zixibacteria bacterium]